MKVKQVLRLSMIFILVMIINSCSSTSTVCTNNKDEYQNGYNSGKLVKLMSGSGSCSEYVDSYNNETGRNTLKATDCFCEGYDDGLNGNTAKY